MAERCIYLTSVVDTGATPFAVEFLRNFDLQKLVEVEIIPDGSESVTARFIFHKKLKLYMQIDVKNAFCVGHKGEGPWGLHDIMIEAGFEEEKASRVFGLSNDESATIIK